MESPLFIDHQAYVEAKRGKHVGQAYPCGYRVGRQGEYSFVQTVFCTPSGVAAAWSWHTTEDRADVRSVNPRNGTLHNGIQGG